MKVTFGLLFMIEGVNNLFSVVYSFFDGSNVANSFLQMIAPILEQVEFFCSKKAFAQRYIFMHSNRSVIKAI